MFNARLRSPPGSEEATFSFDLRHNQAVDGTGRGSRQLAALAQVAAVLEEAGLDYWLFGGWAVDFYAGSITRPHADIDIAVWETDLPALARLLKAHGWTHAPSEEDDGGTGYERGGVRLELTYLASDGAGGVFTRLRQGRARWAPETFADDVR